MTHIATHSAPEQPLRKVCAWCPGYNRALLEKAPPVSHGICADCAERQRREDTNARRRAALDTVAQAIHAYLAIQVGEIRPMPRLEELTPTQQSRLLAAGLIGVSSIDISRFLKEAR